MLSLNPFKRPSAKPLAAILEAVQNDMGPLKSETLSSVVGFQNGGPINMIEAEDESYFVTSEMCQPKDFARSKEGLRYELALNVACGQNYARSALTFLAGHFIRIPIGSGERISLGEIDSVPPLEASIRLISAKAKGLGCYVIEPRNPKIFAAENT